MSQAFSLHLASRAGLPLETLRRFKSHLNRIMDMLQLVCGFVNAGRALQIGLKFQRQKGFFAVFG